MPRHGGRREPDGRQAQAPGVGAKAKRHDLEQPRSVPPLAGSDLQSGDVQELQQGQKVQPIPTQTSTGTTTGADQEKNRQGLQIPDAIDFAGQRTGQNLGAQGQGSEPLDMDGWLPLLRALAANPKRSGPLAVQLQQQIANAANTPGAGRVRVVDENQIQLAIEQSYG